VGRLAACWPSHGHNGSTTMTLAALLFVLGVLMAALAVGAWLAER
jgi:hypothetical protein